MKVIAVLIVMLSLFACVMLTGCKETDEIKGSITDIESSQNELRELLDAVKKTADNAATQASLAAIEEKLNSIENVTASKEALEAVQQKLAVLKDSMNDTITVQKLDLSYKISAVIDKLNANKEASDKALEDLAEEVAAELEDLKEAVAAEIDALKKELAEDISGVSASLAALETKVSELEKKANDMDAAHKKDIDDLKSGIATLNTTVSGLQEAIASADEKADGKIDVDAYNKATEILYGDGSYSLKAFDIVCSIDPDEYDDAVAENFEATAERLRFFLQRALTEKQIIGYFDELKTAKNGLKTLAESFKERLDAIEKGTINLGEEKVTELDALVATYTKIQNKGITVNETLTTKYTAIKTAYDALKAAKEYADWVNGKIDENSADKLVYGKYDLDIIKDTYIPELEAKDAFNEVNSVWYTEDVTPASMLSMETYNASCARHEKLVEAKAKFDEMMNGFNADLVNVVKGFNTTLPSYTLKDGVQGQYDAYTAIVNEYSLNDANANAMLKIDEDVYYSVLLKNSQNYLAQFTAEVMKAVEDLKTEIAGYTVNGDINSVKYTDKANIVGVAAKITALKDTVNAFNVYGSSDTNAANLTALLVMNETSSVDTEYGKLTDRVAALDEAVAKIGELTEDVEETIANALEALAKQNEEIFPYNAIFNALKAYKDRYNAIKTDYTISDAAEAVNSELLADVKAKIYNSYEDDVKGLNGIYVEATKALTKTVKDLKDMFAALEIAIVTENNGKDANFDVLVPLSSKEAIVNIYNILYNNFEAQNIYLPDLEEVNIRTLINNVTALQRAYDRTLKAAVEAYNGIASVIGAANALATNDVRNYQAYLDAYNSMIATMVDSKYLDKVPGDTVAAQLNYVKDLTPFFSDSITIAPMDDIYDTFEGNYGTIKALYDAFVEAWASLKAEMEELMASTYTVHSIDAFKAIDTTFKTHIATYYGGASDVADNMIDGEKAFYTTFSTKLAEAEAIADAATDEYDEIVAAINALIAKYGWDVTSEVINAADGEYSAIVARIDAFWSTYCSTHNDCSCVTKFEKLIEDSELRVNLQVAYTKVLLTKEYNTCLAAEESETAKDNLTNYFKGMFRTNFEAAIANVETVEGVQEICANYIELINPNASH